MGTLQNKSIVIIGGTSGLGLSAAVACLKAGAKVVAVGRDDAYAAQAQSTLGNDAVVLTADATDPNTSTDAIAKAIERFGQFDGLYHVAGASARRMGDGPLHEMTDEGIDAAINLNLKSLIYSNRAAVRTLLARKTPGTILNLSSVLAYSPSPKFFATHGYAAAKAAIIGLTRSCAAYYASQLIRFNVIAPGLVDTPMAQRAAGDDNILAFIRHKQSLDGGRIGRPEDLDAAVVYLLSDESRFVTGQVLAVDGGWSVSEGAV